MHQPIEGSTNPLIVQFQDAVTKLVPHNYSIMIRGVSTQSAAYHLVAHSKGITDAKITLHGGPGALLLSMLN